MNKEKTMNEETNTQVEETQVVYPHLSILHSLGFMESLVYFADAELVLGGIEPNSAYYAQAESERDNRIKAIAEFVDDYCQRRVAQSLAQAEKRRGVEAAQ